MESNDKAINEIISLMQKHGVTLEQLAEYQTSRPVPVDHAMVPVNVFAYLGAIFVLGGISAYISMFWDVMSSFTRVFITLGFGIGLSVLSIIAARENKYPRVIMPLIIIAALLETSGWFVMIAEYFPRGGDPRKAAAFVFALMAIQEWLTYRVFKRTELFFFAVVFTYGFFENQLNLFGVPWEYINFILGISLIFVTDWVAKSSHRVLAGLGFVIGTAWLSTGLYCIVEKQVSWSMAAIVTGITICSIGYGIRYMGWVRLSALGLFIGSCIFYSGLFNAVFHTSFELFYLAVAIMLMYASSMIESTALLITSTFAILGFIGYYTTEHFVDSIGWPITLVLLGVLFFAVSAFAVNIGRKK